MNRKTNGRCSFLMFFSLLTILGGCGKKDDPAPLALISFSPVSGAVGDMITLTGTGFSSTSSANTVSFNGVNASVTASTSTSITVVVPAKSFSGRISVQVGSSSATSDKDFQRVALVTTIAGSTAGFSNGKGTSALFNYPRAVDVDGAGNIYVAERKNYAVRKITPDGTVTTIAGTGSSGYNEGVGTVATFLFPVGIAIGSNGDLFVSDQGNSAVRKITSSSNTVSTFVGGVQGYFDATGTSAKFNGLYQLAFDKSGNLFTADIGDQSVRKITPAGVVTTLAGNGDGLPDVVEGQGTAARLDQPADVAVDASGNIFVAEYGCNCIRKITPTGNAAIFAGARLPNATTDGNLATARFSGPFSLVFDSKGNLYIADFDSSRIRKISPDGNVTTIAGSVAGMLDGRGPLALFDHPTGIAVDPDDNIIVADEHNNRIRKIVP